MFTSTLNARKWGIDPSLYAHSEAYMDARAPHGKDQYANPQESGESINDGKKTGKDRKQQDA